MKKLLIAAFAAIALLGGCRQSPELTLTSIEDDIYMFPAELFSGASAQEMRELNPSGICTGALNAFLLQKDGKNILFDAGAGSDKSMLQTKLNDMGIKPKDIDAVFITHCHYDHIGGLIKGDKAAFPKAVVYISKPEFKAWSDMTSGDSNSIFAKMVQAYKGRIKQFDYEVPVLCGIICHDAKGHTPGHTIYEIGNTLIFGDLLHGKEYQLKNPNICASFDMDKGNAVKNRIYYYHYASKNHKRVAAMHLPDGGIIEDFATVYMP